MGRFSEKKKGSLASLKDKADNVNNNTNNNDNVSNDVNTNINANNNDNDNTDINKPVLQKREKSKAKLVGLYLNQEQRDKLNDLANKTNKSKSEIARMAVDYFYDNVEIK